MGFIFPGSRNFTRRNWIQRETTGSRWLSPWLHWLPMGLTILNSDAAGVSFPEFFDILRQIVQ